jgi:hypothetical protein
MVWFGSGLKKRLHYSALRVIVARDVLSATLLPLRPVIANVPPAVTGSVAPA